MKKNVVVLLLVLSCYGYSQHSPFPLDTKSDFSCKICQEMNIEIDSLDQFNSEIPLQLNKGENKNYKTNVSNLRDSIIYLYNENDKRKNTFLYNKDEKQIKSLSYYWKNNSWEFNSRTTIGYNLDGHRMLDQSDYYEDGAWVPRHKSEITRTPFLYEERNYEWEGGWKLNSSWRDEYSTDYNQILHRFEIVGYGGHESKYFYNNQNRYSEIIELRWEEDGDEDRSKKVYEYDLDGNSRIKTNYSWINSEWIKTYRDLSIEEYNRTIHELTQLWESDNWINSRQYFIYYGIDNYSDSSLYQVWNGIEWENESRRREEDNGFEGISYNERWENNAWKVENYSTWKEDLNGNSLFWKSVTTQNKITFMTIFSSEYDKNGNKIFQEHSDYHGDTLNYTEKKTYEYDSKNREIIGKYYQWGRWFEGNSDKASTSYSYYKIEPHNFIREDQLDVSKYSLFQNYPNPFNPYTKISFISLSPGDVTISLYNMLGQKVRTIAKRWFPNGVNYIEFNSSGLPSGSYFYRLEVDGFAETKKMIILK